MCIRDRKGSAIYFVLEEEQEALLDRLQRILSAQFLRLTPVQTKRLLPKSQIIRLALEKGLVHWIEELEAAGIVETTETSAHTQRLEAILARGGAAATSTSVAAATDPVNVSDDTAIRMKMGKKPKKSMTGMSKR